MAKRTIQLKPTIILENDHFFWKGTDEFLAQFGEYTQMNPSVREQFFIEDKVNDFCMMLSQPVVERICAVSSFQNHIPVPTEHPEFDEKFCGMNQLGFFVQFLQDIQNFRMYLEYKPLEYHIVYNGVNFLQDLHDGDFGKETLGRLYRFSYQQPEVFKVKIYDGSDDDFKFLYELNEENLKPRK